MRLSLSSVCYYHWCSIKEATSKCAGLIGPLEVTFKENHFLSRPAELERFCAFYSQLIYSSLCCPSFVSPFSHPSSFFFFVLPVFTAGLRPLKEGGRARGTTLESTSGTRAAVGSVTTSHRALPPRGVCGASDWKRSVALQQVGRIRFVMFCWREKPLLAWRRAVGTRAHFQGRARSSEHSREQRPRVHELRGLQPPF